MTDMRLVVVGAAGRMGQTLIRIINETKGASLAAAVEHPDSPALGSDAGELAGLKHAGLPVTSDTASAFAEADGVLDFTTPKATLEFAKLAADAGIVHIIGTTGFTAEEDAQIEEIAKRNPIVKSGNMSLGVNLLAVLVEQAARALESADWDIEVLEMHHRHKVDAPSGTAYLLGAAAARGRQIDLESQSVRVRDGQTGPRHAGNIGFATLRGGSVIGEHSVILAGEGESVELTHKALDRSIYARGAVKAALWAQGRPDGHYSMLDVLGLA